MTAASGSPKGVAPTITEAGLSTTGGGEAASTRATNVVDTWRGWLYWNPGNGVHNLQISWSVINANSTVIITASETSGVGGARFVGSAPFQVSSIAPGSGSVTFKINIDWGSPLPMRTDIVVLN